MATQKTPAIPKSTLIVLATGLGKTVIAGLVAREWSRGRVLFLAHREELINQAADKIGKVTGQRCDIEQASKYADACAPEDRRRIVVGSVQTLNVRRDKRYRMERFDPRDFGLIITDEAHHATANSYRRIYEHFGANPDIAHLGVTATPDRSDEEALGQVFSSVSYEYDIAAGIDDGWLVPVEQGFVTVDSLDLSGLKTNRGDFTDAAVHAAMVAEETIHKTVSPLLDLGDKKTLIFAAGVEQAEKIAEVINRHKPGAAAAISGKTDKQERKQLLRKFALGEIQYISNCAVLTEGFDEPSVEVIAMARPTKSRALYSQVIGRGTRTLPGVVDGLQSATQRRLAIQQSGKPSVLVLDFVGNAGHHKLVCTADVLGGKETLDVVKEAADHARQASKRGETTDMQEEIKKAKAEIEERARLARIALKAKADYQIKKISPFDLLDIMPKREPGWHKGRKPTEKQKNVLKKFGVDAASIEKFSFLQASQMIDNLILRSKEGKCSYKQAKLLARYGEKSDVGFGEASAIIDSIARNGWKPRKSKHL